MKKILLIEDNEDIRSNTAEILELSNYEVIVAENGKIGVEKAVKHIPDLIICDIMMPVLDGYGVLHAIHKNEAIKNTPFIFLTAKTERSDFRKGMELGADDYITKPFSGTELLSAVDIRLKRVELLRQELSAGLAGLNQLQEAYFNKDGQDLLASDRSISKFKKKQTIYTEGSWPHRLYYVLSGKVKAFKANEDGKEFVTELYDTGDFLGYVPLLEESVYKDTAEALEVTELAEIPKTEFEELINKNAEVAKRFLQLLAKNVSAQEDKLLGLAYDSLRKKVANAILNLHHKFQAKDDEGFILDISRESLATMAGTATESLIRTLSDFRSEKLIDIQNGTIKILNEKKLTSLL